MRPVLWGEPGKVIEVVGDPIASQEAKRKKRSFTAKVLRTVEVSGTGLTLLSSLPSPPFERMYLSYGCPTNELQKHMTCWRKSALELSDLIRWSSGFWRWCWNNELRLLRLLGWTECVLHVTNMQFGERSVCLRVDKDKWWGPHLHLNYINSLRSWECRQHLNSLCGSTILTSVDLHSNAHRTQNCA